MKIPLTIADKLPTAKSGMTRSGGLGKRSPLNVPLMDATGKAISSAGRVAEDIYGRMINAQRQREATQALTDMTDGFNQIQDDISTNRAWIADQKLPEEQRRGVPDLSAYTVDEHESLFKQRSSDLKQSVLGKMKDYRARESMTKRYDQESSNEMIKTQKVAWNREIDRSRATTTKALATLEDNFVNNGDSDSLAKGDAIIDSAVSVGTYSQVEGEALKDKFSREAFLGFWDNQIKVDAMGVRFDLFGDHLDKNGNLILKKEEELPESFKRVSADEKNRVVNAARAGWKTAKIVARNEYSNQVEEAINTYVAADSKELKKDITKQQKDTIDYMVKIGVFSRKEGRKEYKKFKNNSVATDWMRQADDTPYSTFESVFTKSTDGKGFRVKGLEGQWGPKQHSKLTSEWSGMDEEAKRRLSLYLRTKYEQEYARRSFGNRKRKLVLNDDMKNDLAFLKATGKGDPEIETKIRIAYAEEPDTMEQVLEIHDRNQTLAKVSNDWSDKLMKAGPIEQAIITDNISMYAEGGGIVTKGYKIDPQDAEASRLWNDLDVQKLSGWRRAQFVSNMEAAAYKKSQALEKDPAGFVNKHYKEELRNLTEGERPSFIIAEQLRLGVPGHNVGLLTETQAENVVGRLEALTGEEKVVEIQRLQQSLPPGQFKVVYRDLVKQDLPTGTMFLITQDQPSQELVRQSYAKVLDMDEKELKDSLGGRGTDVVKEFNSAYDSAIQDYINTVSNQGGGEMDTIRLSGVRAVIKKAVMNDAKNSSIDVSDTTTKYVDKSFNDLYNYQNDYRMPKQFNPDNIKYYTNFIERTLEDQDILAPGSMNRGLGPDYLRGVYLDNIRIHGRWVNSPDGSGLSLLDSNNQPVLSSPAPGKVMPVIIPFALANELGGEMIAGVGSDLGITAEGVTKELETILAPVIDLTESMVEAGIRRDKAIEKSLTSGVKMSDYFLRGGRGLY